MTDMNMQEYIEQAEKDLLHTYNRFQIVLDRGEGVHLYDINGKEYLDFVAGISVFALGYGNKEYKTEEITIPDPNAYFDLTITDIMDKVIASEGYGQQMSHDISLKDKISILVDGKSYKLVMNGFNIVTDITISK